ncbi:MAG: molecular chaperone DnaK [Acidobacteria bacterium]|nr:molecular chaperone DnaK [Acidobacteriota bacterium]
MQTRLRAGRAEQPSEGRDDIDQSDDNISGHLSFSLLELKSETLAHITAALARLDAGHYGSCVTCLRPIESRRLRALPFAVHCQPCAEQRERQNVSATASFSRDPLSEPTGGAEA